MLPDLILLDLNMPRMSGHEVLTVIKDSSDWKHIPVVVLTTSGANEDVLDCYQRHASAFVTKPMNFDDFATVVRQIDEFYEKTAMLPPRVIEHLASETGKRPVRIADAHAGFRRCRHR